MSRPSATADEAPTASVLCEARDVAHAFALPNGMPRTVLEGIDLTIRPNEVVALLGPTGCGKSTLLRILAGLLKPSRGEVQYHGRTLDGLNPGVSIVFQSFALYPWMTVAENVRAPLNAKGQSRLGARRRAHEVIRLVGLEGFEEVYPRELSGGMKQRVGIARALAVDPEILFMDEPFSQVDALTAESLRAEVLDIWAADRRNPSSILMVSHDIKEVAYMADRIVILGANPGRVRKVVRNALARPRDYRSAELIALMDHLHEIITGAELPDVPPPAPPEAGLIEPLPQASTSEIVGLLEYLDARGGRQDLFRIAADTNREFGVAITVVKSAEMLGFVDTPKNVVLLESGGRRFVQARAEQRKVIWREQLLKLRLFQEVVDELRRHPQREVDRQAVQEMIVKHMPQEDYEKIFSTLVRWARFGDLFDYDETTGKISLPQ